MKIEERKGELKPLSSEFENIYSRETAPLVRKSVDEETRSIEGVVATELPAMVFDWSRWEPIQEILLMDGVELPESKQVIMLDTHTRYWLSAIKGSTRELRVEDDPKLGRVLMGRNFFAHNAEDEFKLAKDGHLTDTSVGYKVYNKFTEKLRPGERKVINGKEFINKDESMDLWIRTKWTLLENSLVPIGADKAAKLREMFSGKPEEPIEINKTLSEEAVNDIKNSLKENNEQLKIIINQKEQVKMDDEKKLQDQQRVDAINKLAEKFAGKVNGVDLMDAAELYKAGGKSEREFADMIFENQKQQAAVAGPTVHLSEKELKIYNPANAVRSLVNKTNSLEREVSDQYAKNSGISPAGIFIPHNAVLPKMRTGRRDLTAGTANSAAELVGTDHLGAQFIDYLYEKMVLDNITFLPNRKGNVEIPVLSASAGHGWAATEVTAVAEGAPTTTERTASPKRGGRFIEMTKQLMIQSDPDAESLFVNDLLKSLAIGIQNAVLNGTGASGQPTGVKLTSGIGSVGSLASMDFDKAVLFETLIDDAFGDGNGMYFVTRRAHSGALKTRKIDAGSGRFVNENNVINGYGVRTTNLVADGDMFFGDWTNIIVPLWDGVDLVFDPYTKAAEGMVKVTANQLLDIIVRYPSAFSYGSSFS